MFGFCRIYSLRQQTFPQLPEEARGFVMSLKEVENLTADRFTIRMSFDEAAPLVYRDVKRLDENTFHFFTDYFGH
ncbi:MAG: hypothetical protein WBW88_20625 [Rhodothermales bacterium]